MPTINKLATKVKKKILAFITVFLACSLYF
jgi:hypothetical protein